MGKSHYEDLFNYLSNSKDVNTICKNAEYQKDVEEIMHAIKDLKDNKSCGLDGISAEHLKHCSDVIIPLLSMCFTSWFVHGILTESLISVVLVPIVKNKTASICSKSNYRLIALEHIKKVVENIRYQTHAPGNLFNMRRQCPMLNRHWYLCLKSTVTAGSLGLARQLSPLLMTSLSGSR